MATDTFPSESSLPSESKLSQSIVGSVQYVLKLFASLELTVALFFFAIVLIFVGTLAQVEMNMWQVIEHYFKSVIAWTDLGVLLPSSWFPELHKLNRIPDIQIPLPGGFSLGVLMAVNLLAAHLIRFKVQSRGTRMYAGIAVFAVGAWITYLVIQSGHNSGGLQGDPPFEWPTLWKAIRVALFTCAIASGLALSFTGKQSSIGKKVLLSLLTVTFLGLAFWSSSVMLTKPSLRILWQLIQGGLSGIILLVGCIMLFKRRAGVVLLHLGIGLMMFSEFFVGQYAVEERISLEEGETTNFARDIRSVELAIVDTSDPNEDKVIAVPGSRLVPKRRWFGRSDDQVVVQDAELPFDLHIQQYMRNSELIKAEEAESNVATVGSGLTIVAKPARPSSGTDGGEVDYAAAYVDIRKKGTDESLGTYLLSQIMAADGMSEKVEVDGQVYDVSLRFKRSYKPYLASLKDVRKDDYLGTNMPMNYSSDVVLTRANDQGQAGESIGEFHIWMNNPLRYSGETFYQSGYFFNPRTETETTTLQVVRNTGWMMPYIGCMLVGVGMAAHFCVGLWRFLEKRLSEELVTPEPSKFSWLEAAVPFVIMLVFGGYVVSKFRPPTDTKANMKIHEFGKLPVVYEGRVKPLDTLARNTLRIVSNKETFIAGDQDPKKRPPKLPAIRWMLDVISGSPEARTHRVYRIDHLDVLATLGLERRKGFRYAEEEFQDKLGRDSTFFKQLSEARELEPEDMSLYQKKLIELERRLRTVRLLEFAFTPIPVPEMPTEAEFKANQEEAQARMARILQFVQQFKQLQTELNRNQPPLSVPTGENKWEAFANAWGAAYVARLTNNDIPKSTQLWAEMLSAYGSTDVRAFNEAVSEYHGLLAQNTPTIRNAEGDLAAIDLEKVRFEHFFNSSQLFKYCMVLYIAAFVFVCLAWLAASVGNFRVLNRTSFWLIVLTLTLHSFALWSRVYISGRPPITNLYSSAVFIGWGAVMLGMLLEFFFKLGIGNALSAIAGFSTLLIAYALAADGDTFTVLRAVLDTQFWLATHVVCITLGYSTTFVAGLLGLIYVLSFASRQPALGKALTSMTYGTLCFAIFFSFIGTVLGGLWADDSWGRFWGWDPKENGALMIVLWNALVLHARWGGLIRQRGMALLAILGNVVTSWSWFGVNELGVGLHSYGFTEGVLMYLGLFVFSQLLIVGVGLATMFPNKKNELVV